MNLQPTTLKNATAIVASVLGIDLAANKKEAIAYVNRIRALQYHAFADIPLFDDLMECVPIQKFGGWCAECPEYTGVSLPTYMAGVVSAWFDNVPLTLRSRWKEKDVGRNQWGPGLDLIEMPGHFPTSADVSGSQFIKITSTNKKDNGKLLTMTCSKCDGEETVVFVELMGSGAVDTDVAITNIKCVVLPDLVGGVTLSEVSTGRELARYRSCSPTVPSFRRFKLQQPCADPQYCSVLVQASRQYEDVGFDDDVVEVGDRLVLEHGARIFLYGESTTDRNELRRSELDRARMFDLIRGMRARRIAGSIQDGQVIHRRGRKYGRTLPGYR